MTSVSLPTSLLFVILRFGFKWVRLHFVEAFLQDHSYRISQGKVATMKFIYHRLKFA